MLDYRAEIDRPVYEELRGFLPARVFDAHVHCGLPEHVGELSPERRKGVGFYLDACATYGYNPIELSRVAHATLYPEQRVEALYFGYPFREVDLDANNAYLARLIRERGVFALYLARPTAGRAELERAIAEQGFLGFKPYPDLVVGKSALEIRVGDYVSPAMWEVANAHGAIVLIHPNRPGRLYDYLDIKDIVAASNRYSRARVIVAHLARAYLPSLIVAGVPEEYREASNIWFDLCPVCDAEVLTRAIAGLGPKRLLFATDSPFTYMRGRLGECRGERKFFTSGGYAWNTDREPPRVEASYTFYHYEQLRALKAAAGRLGLARRDLEDMLYNNARQIIAGVQRT